MAGMWNEMDKTVEKLNDLEVKHIVIEEGAGAGGAS